MFPELFKIPGLGIPLATYGVLLAIGFILALWLAARLAARDGLPKQRIYDLGLYVLAAGLVGSKALMVITEWNDYGGDWRRMLSVDFLRSGGVFYGGLLGAVLVSVILMRLWHLPWPKTADAFAPGIALGHAIGRLGCFSAGCCWGKPTTLPWGVEFGELAHRITGVPVGVHLHPTQLYESAACLVIFLLLLGLHRRKRFDGEVIAAYAVLYGMTRFLIEFVRDDPRGDIFGLTSLTGLSTSQLISLVVIIGGIVFLVRRRRRANREGSDAQAASA